VSAAAADYRAAENLIADYADLGRHP